MLLWFVSSSDMNLDEGTSDICHSYSIMGVLGFKGMLFTEKMIKSAPYFVFSCWWKQFRARVGGYYCVTGKKKLSWPFFIVQLDCQGSISLPDVCMITWEASV